MTKLRLFNTLSGKLEDFRPQDAEAAGREGRPARVKLYVCGPTVYDEAHLGHARCYITWDVLYRFLKFLGYDVTYVRNVTDVDDKILNKADALGMSPEAVAAQFYDSFAADMRALNVLPPDAEPRATAHIPTMIEAIQALIGQGAAYVTPEGTVYFRVAAKSDYGKLSKKPLDDLKAGARVEVDPHKKSPLDFALWKHVGAEEQQKPGHAFDSPWGKGRPGWHIECSAMNRAVFGSPQIDIHAGGADLIFPHHENEIAQSEAWSGCTPFARYWLHNGFVNVSGEKMSKSLGNFSTIKKVLERYDANTIRYFLLTNGYRMPVDFNDEALASAARAMERIHRQLREACKRLNVDELQVNEDRLSLAEFEKEAPGWETRAAFKVPVVNFELFVQDLKRDLSTPSGLSRLHQLAPELDAIGRAWDERGPESSYFDSTVRESFILVFRLSITVFTVLGFDISLIFGDAASLSEADIKTVETLLLKRKQAKAEKNWKEADAIREQITQKGLKLLDNKDGSTSVESNGVEVLRV